MGVPMDGCRAGTLVWVQRKNGSWWPGRVLDPNDFSHSKHHLGTPVKLLGKEDGSMEWYNFEKSKRVKAFRCGEFDDCIRKAESSQSSYSYRIAKYAHRGGAILHALELEKLEAKKKRKSSGVSKSLLGEERAGIICRGKRSRRVFVSDESNNFWKHATINIETSNAPSSLKMQKNPLKSDVAAADETSTRTTGLDTSENDFTGRLQMHTQISGNARNGANGSRYFGKYYVRSVNLYRKGKGELNNDFSSSPPHHPSKPVSESHNSEMQEKEEGIPNLTKRQRVLLIDGKNHKKTSTPSPDDHSGTKVVVTARTSSYLKRCSSSKCSDKTDVVGFPQRTETTLFDVEVTVRIQCGREHVPLVSLMSKTNKQAIVGHPIDIEELHDGSSDAFLAQKHGLGCLPSDGFTRAMFPPTWKRSKRTPVCYLPKDAKEACVPRLSEITVKEELEFTTRPLKKRPLPVPNCVITCVPVKVIFEKLLMAVGKA